MTSQLNEDLFGLQPSGPRETFKLKSNREMFDWLSWGLSKADDGPPPERPVRLVIVGQRS